MKNANRLARVMGGAAALLSFAVLATSAAAQGAEDLVGSWRAVSVTVDQDGRTYEPYGAEPEGMLIFGSDGHYALILARHGLPAFASGERTAGTAEENEAVVAGSIAHYGSYAVEEDGLLFRIEGATFPNWTGTEQKRGFTLSDGKLRYEVPSASSGGKGEVVWQRAE